MVGADVNCQSACAAGLPHPEGETKEYPRTYHELPPSPKEIKPHPYGIEFGALLKMLQDTKSHTVAAFWPATFAVSPALAEEM